MRIKKPKTPERLDYARRNYNKRSLKHAAIEKLAEQLLPEFSTIRRARNAAKQILQGRRIQQT